MVVVEVKLLRTPLLLPIQQFQLGCGAFPGQAAQRRMVEMPVTAETSTSAHARAFIFLHGAHLRREVRLSARVVDQEAEKPPQSRKIRLLTPKLARKRWVAELAEWSMWMRSKAQAQYRCRSRRLPGSMQAMATNRSRLKDPATAALLRPLLKAGRAALAAPSFLGMQSYSI